MYTKPVNSQRKKKVILFCQNSPGKSIAAPASILFCKPLIVQDIPSLSSQSAREKHYSVVWYKLSTYIFIMKTSHVIFDVIRGLTRSTKNTFGFNPRVKVSAYQISMFSRDIRGTQVNVAYLYLGKCSA